MVHEFTQISFDGTECFSIRIQLPLKMVLSELKRIRENNKMNLWINNLLLSGTYIDKVLETKALSIVHNIKS